jgi:hypothetical protein
VPLHFLTREFAVAQNPTEQTSANGFAGVDWDHRGATVGVPHEVVTPLDPNQ